MNVQVNVVNKAQGVDARIEQQRQHAVSWQRTESARRSHMEQRNRELERQRRNAQYRYQQDYYRRWLAQQSRWNASRHDYYNDPYYYTASNYRYRYGGTWYNTNQYGANLLRQAVRDGYQEGYYAGRADRMDRWRFDYSIGGKRKTLSLGTYPDTTLAAARRGAR